MPIRSAFLPALALSAILTLPAHAEEVDASTVVASVNGIDITIGHMIIARATLPQQYQQLPDQVLYQGILDQLIQQSALAQSYEETPPNRIQLSLENEERSLLAGEALEDILADALTPDAIQAAYDAEYKNAEQGTEYNASHILVETEDEAKALVEELAGGADFAQLARDNSTGPSGPGGGSLGWFSDGMMVPTFEEAVKSLEVGDVSAPVQTQFGWHVITLNETRIKDVPALDDVKAEIEAKIRDEAVQDAVDALVEKAQVDRPDNGTIDPAILKDLTLLD